jgi:protease-4
LKYYPEQKPFFEQLMSQFEENAKTDALKTELGEYYIWYEQMQKIKTYQGEQARMPFELHFH